MAFSTEVWRWQSSDHGELSEVTNLTKGLNACTDHIKTWMTENQLTLHDDKTALLFPFSSSLKPSTVSLPDSIALGSHNIPFSDSCQEPSIHSWLKTVHEEARHKNLPNCLFRA